jgi:hypothetical protein
MNREREVIRELAKKAGCTVKRCDPSWGGTWAYSVLDKNYSVCGLKTEQAAYESFMKEELGDYHKMVTKLIRENIRLKADLKERI